MLPICLHQTPLHWNYPVLILQQTSHGSRLSTNCSPLYFKHWCCLYYYRSSNLYSKSGPALSWIKSYRSFLSFLVLLDTHQMLTLPPEVFLKSAFLLILYKLGSNAKLCDAALTPVPGLWDLFTANYKKEMSISPKTHYAGPSLNLSSRPFFK